MLVDKNALNIRDLATNTQGTTYVEFDGSINADPVKEVRTPTFTQEEYNMPNIIRSDGLNAMWMDMQALWWQWDRSITATENQESKLIVIWDRFL